jgi:drug/metabolite transporter superfamily protein YnfA
MVYFSEKRLTRAVQTLSVLFTALALTGAIIALHYIVPTGWCFGALGGFLLVFSLAVGTLTNARTPEMFAATAAYVPAARLSLRDEC